MTCLEEDRARRLRSVQQSLSRHGHDALLIAPGADLRYLTGYDALPLERLTCLVVPAAGDVTLIVPRLERPAAEAACDTGIAGRVVDYPDGVEPYPLVALALAGRAPTVAVGERTWAGHLLRLQTALPDTRWVSAAPVMAESRARKSPAEVAALAEAGEAIDAVHEQLPHWLRPGRTELEVGADIAAAMREAGHVSVDFVIVASGPNAASPHHDTSSRVLEVGEPVVVDIGGAMASGYCSDCTRTYHLGSPTAEFAASYDVLQAAQRAAVAAVAPGVSAHAVDATARDRITAAGYGPYFVHRTGHGIGLDTHEEPYIVAGSHEILTDGMVFSVEPGIYLPGEHGARIEDIVVCTPTGARRLNLTSTDLVVL